MSIYVQHDGKQLGPFTEAEIKAQLASGAISPHDHVWWEGQKDWVMLSQTPYGGLIAPGVTVVPGTAAPYSGGGAPVTSQLAIWALVCGCLSLLCGVFASVPAIILGHMGRSQIKKNPALQGGGMALAGLIIGYIMTVFAIVGIVVYISLLPTILKAAQEQQQQLKGQVPTPDQTTNAPDQSTPVPASPDQSTNNPASSTPASPPSTNAPDSTTNAAPMSQ